MPRVDVREVDEAGDFTPFPAGRYPCECDEVTRKKNANGDEMWAIKWAVIDGEHAGRTFFDNLVFSESALSRVKLVAKRVAGIDVDAGPFDFEPDHLVGKRAMIEVEINSYTDKEGKQRQNNKPTFGGYDYYNDGAPADQVPAQKDVTIRSSKPAAAATARKKETLDVPF